MARKLKGICRKSGCGRRTHHGWCEAHLNEEKKQRWKQQDTKRADARTRGYDTHWTKVSKAFRRAHPLCAKCEALGFTVAADEVDHIIPVRERPDLVYDWSNLQSLCRSHHAKKTRRDGSGARAQARRARGRGV